MGEKNFSLFVKMGLVMIIERDDVIWKLNPQKRSDKWPYLDDKEVKMWPLAAFTFQR